MRQLIEVQQMEVDWLKTLHKIDTIQQHPKALIGKIESQYRMERKQQPLLPTLKNTGTISKEAIKICQSKNEIRNSILNNDQFSSRIIDKLKINMFA